MQADSDEADRALAEFFIIIPTVNLDERSRHSNRAAPAKSIPYTKNSTECLRISSRFAGDRSAFAQTMGQCRDGFELARFLPTLG
jgi:hypothetical protein